MLLVIDVGNTNIKIGAFRGTTMVGKWRLATDTNRTSDEYGIATVDVLRTGGIEKEDLDGIILSSVVPRLNFTMQHMLQDYLGKKPVVVGVGIKTGLNIRLDNPRELGGDMICDAVSAFRRYGGPCITMDFGTATTLCFTGRDATFQGGCILPGLKVSADALSGKAAELPSVALEVPDTVLGKNTITSMQAGLLYGYIGQIEYLIRKMKAEANAPDAKVIATGGMAQVIAGYSDAIDIVDPSLTLEGLRLIYEMNKKESDKQ